MKIVRGAFCVLAAQACLLMTTVAGAADLLRDVEEAYAHRRLQRTPFDPRSAGSLEPSEARFLEAMFLLTDEGVLLNTDVSRWLFSRGASGLHPVDYLERMDSVLESLEQLETPRRVESVRVLVAESLRLQRGFVTDWHRALENGLPFESQLTDEFAYHEGLHRSQRVLLKAFAELRALFPSAGAQVHAAFRDHLRAVSLP